MTHDYWLGLNGNEFVLNMVISPKVVLRMWALKVWKGNLLVGKDLLGLRRETIDAPSRRTLIVAHGDWKSSVIGTRDFDDFSLVETFQVKTSSLAGESRFFSLEKFFYVSICRSAAAAVNTICKDSNWVICMMRICPFFSISEANCIFLSSLGYDSCLPALLFVRKTFWYLIPQILIANASLGLK